MYDGNLRRAAPSGIRIALEQVSDQCRRLVSTSARPPSAREDNADKLLKWESQNRLDLCLIRVNISGTVLPFRQPKMSKQVDTQSPCELGLYPLAMFLGFLKMESLNAKVSSYSRKVSHRNSYHSCLTPWIS